MGIIGSYTLYEAYKGKNPFLKGVAVIGVSADVVQILTSCAIGSGVLNVTSIVTLSVSAGSKTVTVIAWIRDYLDYFNVKKNYYVQKTAYYENLRGEAMVPLERVDPTTLTEADRQCLQLLENPLFLEQLELLALAADPIFQRIQSEILKRRKTNRLKGKARNLKQKFKTKASNAVGTIVLGLVFLTSSVDTTVVQTPRNTELGFSPEPVERILTPDKTRLSVENNNLRETQTRKEKKTAAKRSEFREAAAKRAEARKATERRPRVRTLRDLPPLEIVEEEVEQQLSSALKTKNRIRIRIREN